ncbi:ABC transporter permease [Paenibacillus harenae]|uniref:NitT/TauT family transport system permease protein n=1 Tax=Paenibacillus harenae TaxID=306543 RepID=A0ABT9U317_PAEHA|nr:ABC transporter permease [Paenibacillus harenae]MDQ0113393.1 NitT/TauT family transport system permease protein [Paenibacillus harenae]
MSISSAETAGKTIVPIGGQAKKNQGWNRFKQYYLGPIIAFILFMTLWEIVPTMLGLKHFIFPKPSDVYKAAIDDWSILTAAIQITVVESLIGFAVSAVVGILLSVLLASSKIMERSIYPYAIILQTIPVVAVAPIVVIWFGAGYKSIVVISFLIGFFPVISNTLMGLNSVDKNMDELFTLYNASKWKKMLKLRIPAAMPYIMAGLKISCTLSIVGAIVGEYVAGIGGGKGGLGYAITVAAIQVKTPFLFACGIAAAILGIGFYLIVGIFAKWVLGSWHESAMKVER